MSSLARTISSELLPPATSGSNVLKTEIHENHETNVYAKYYKFGEYNIIIKYCNTVVFYCYSKIA